MTDEIAVRLSTVNRLVVVPRSASRRFANSGRSAREIGRELGCDYLLEGSVLWGRAADGQSRVRITPRLVRAADGTSVWSEVYDRVLVDTFQVQSDIARQVTEHLHVSLQKCEQAAMALLELHLTDNEEAYKAFLQGRVYATDRDTVQDMNLAVSMFQRAFDFDPKMALASAELARAHSRLYHNGVDRSEQRIGMAKVAAERALGLAPADPRVHLAVAFYYYWVLSDYKGALEHLRIAEKSLANDPELLEVMGFILRRRAKATGAGEATASDSRPAVWTSLMVIEVGNTLRGLRRYKEADTYFAHAIELAPDLVTAYVWRAENFWLWSGSTADARATLESDAWCVAGVRDRGSLPRVPLRGPLRGSGAAPGRHDLEVFATAERYYPRVLLEAEVFSFLGDTARASAAYEAARVLLEAESRRLPNDARLRSALGLAYAGLGRKDDADKRRACSRRQLCPVERDAWSGPDYRRELAHIYTMVGEFDKAVAELGQLLSVPNRWISSACLELRPALGSAPSPPGVPEAAAAAFIRSRGHPSQPVLLGSERRTVANVTSARGRGRGTRFPASQVGRASAPNLVRGPSKQKANGLTTNSWPLPGSKDR